MLTVKYRANRGVPSVAGFTFLSLSVSCGFLTLVNGASAEPLTVNVVDQDGEPLSGAMVSISSFDNAGLQGPQSERIHIMDQVGKRFVPETLIIRAGDSVRFPNSDNIRHHVYSFSKVKPFELPLYSGEPTNPVRFEQPGMIVVGCNIHDRMQGVIYVSDSDGATLTSDGVAEFPNLAPGRVRVEVAHQRALDHRPSSIELEHGTNSPKVVRVTVATAYEGQIEADEGLTELERKFMELRRARN